MRDFEKALALEPTNKKLHVEVRKTRELIKSCVRRTPRQSIPIRETGSQTDKWNNKSRGGGEDEDTTPQYGPTFTEVTEVTEEDDTPGSSCRTEMVCWWFDGCHSTDCIVPLFVLSVASIPTDNGTSTVSIEEIDDEAPPEAAAEEEKEVLSSTPPTSPGSDSSWVHVDNEEEKQNLEEEDEDDEDDTPVRIVVRSVRPWYCTPPYFTDVSRCRAVSFFSPGGHSQRSGASKGSCDEIQETIEIVRTDPENQL